MKVPATGAAAAPNPAEGERKTINAELWHACAGPLVSLPPVGSLVVYFPQGHSEQVAASMQKDIDGHIPNYPNLPTKLICLLHNVTLHADAETDEVYAQMTLQPVNTYDEKALLASDYALKSNKPQTEFFCKTLTASDTSTHGGFSVPRRAAEKIFPPLDFSMQPPAQELQAKDLHDNIWTFRHIYRGQPKRHLLTTGWSLFVSGKRLFAGDSVLFIRDEKQQLLLGTRRANRQPTNISSSVLSSDSMHIGILAAAAHAAANHSPFTIFFNPRASPSEFVIPLAKYQKALYSNQISLGMRFRMMFETEDSGTRRYMGTITGISDLDPVRWKNSQWRNLQVGWDESAAGERRNRVSIWEIEPVAAPFFICPPPFFRSKRPRQPGMPDDEASEMENLFKRAMPWLGEEICIKDSQSQSTIMPGLSLVQWMNMQHNPSLANSNMQPDYIRSGPIQNTDLSRQLGFQDNMQFNSPRLPQQLDQLPKVPPNQFSSVSRPQHQVQNQNQNQNQAGLIQPQMLLQQQQQQQQQQQLLQQQMHQQQNRMPAQFSNQGNQQFQLSEHQMQLQLLRKLQQQQQSLLSQSTMQLPQLPQIQEQRTLLDPPPNLPSSNPVPQQRLQQQQGLSDLHGANLLSTGGSSLLAAPGGQSGITDDVPSCSTSPSTNSVVLLPHPKLNTTHKTPMLTPETIVANPNAVRELPKCQKSLQCQYLNTAQMDYLDTSSSSTSVCLSQQSLPLASFNQPSICDPRNNVLFGVNIEDSLGLPLTKNPLLSDTIDSGKYPNPISDYNSKDTQQELSSSIVSQSFGVPDLAFNSIDSVLDESSFLNKSSWPPAPQFQRMRTYTKVYKRGAVGRSIDITRYSGYDELKRDLARMFSIEGQLEDRQRIGWKLVYVDHEKDVLLVGDDPWEEFVGCVRCIRILSPQEVQQMSLDGCDLGNSILTNQACSSSDGGNGWSRQPDQNSGNPSAGSYDGP